MARTGLTNFVAWALAATAFSSLVLLAGPEVRSSVLEAVVIAVVALGVAWWTRYWPEALGVAAGTALSALLTALSGRGADHAVAGLLVASAVVLIWRRRLDDPLPAGPPTPGSSSRPRLAVASVLAAAVLLPVNFLLELIFGFGACAGDTTPPPPAGSALEAYCNSDNLVFPLIVIGPSALILVVGLIAAYRRQARPLLFAVVAGLVLSIAAHAHEWVLAS